MQTARGQIGYFFSPAGAAAGGAGAASVFFSSIFGGAGGAVFVAAFFSPQPMTAMADTNSTIANNFFIALVS